MTEEQRKRAVEETRTVSEYLAEQERLVEPEYELLAKWHSSDSLPPYTLFNAVRQSIYEYDCLAEGEHIRITVEKVKRKD